MKHLKPYVLGAGIVLLLSSALRLSVDLHPAPASTEIWPPHPMMPAACIAASVYVDESNISGCASDGNTCQSATCGGGSSGPCRSLEEWNRRCGAWYEEETCLTLMRVTVDGHGPQDVTIGGPRSHCNEDPKKPDGGQEVWL